MLRYAIPWNDYSEEEVQYFLEYIFKRRGYQVYNIHKADRRGEDGADLECIKKGEAETLLVAVKKKPAKKDIQQLRDLSSRDVHSRIYVYIEAPSADFFREMEKNRNNVSFWDATKLTNELFDIDPRLYLFMVLENRFYAPSYSTNWNNISHYRKVIDGKIEIGEPEKMDSDMLLLLWNAKDRSVSLNRGLNLLQLTFEESMPLKLNKTETISLINGYLHGLERLKVHALTPLLECIERYRTSYPNIFSLYCKQTDGRSNWRYFYNHQPVLLPSQIKEYFEKMKEDEEKYAELNKEIEEDETFRKYTDDDRGYLLGDVARILGFWPFVIESMFDDIFSICLYGDWRAHRDKSHIMSGFTGFESLEDVEKRWLDRNKDVND